MRIRKGRIGATTTITLKPNRSAGLRLVRLHAVGLRVSSVTLGAKRCLHKIAAGELHITLPRVYRQGETVTLVIRYTATPKKGLYFFSPDHAYPKRPLQVWSQGRASTTGTGFPATTCPTIG